DDNRIALVSLNSFQVLHEKTLAPAAIEKSGQFGMIFQRLIQCGLNSVQMPIVITPRVCSGLVRACSSTSSTTFCTSCAQLSSWPSIPNSCLTRTWLTAGGPPGPENVTSRS